MIVILITVGQAGGNHLNNNGGGSNYICSPNDPDNGIPYSYHNDVLYGAENGIAGSNTVNHLDWIIYTIETSRVLYVDVVGLIEEGQTIQ